MHRFERGMPYNGLPPIPPRGTELETKAVLKRAIAAHRALAELKGAGDLIPNQAVLVHVIGLQEAKLSSEVENIVTTNDELYRAHAADVESTDPATKEVLRYNDALWYGFEQLKSGRPLGTSLCTDIVQVIKGNTAGVRKSAGTRIENTQGGVIYTPPSGEEDIRDKLSNLEQFIHGQDDIDRLVKLAVLHYQFEAIHPFADGNGRTGRILNILYLVDSKLLDVPVLYLSRYILEHKSEYYSGLRGVTERGEWEPWILYMLGAVEQTAIDTHNRIMSIRDLMLETSETVKTQAPKIYSKDLIELLFAQPYCRIRFLEVAGIAKREAASRYLRELTRIGVLHWHKVGRESYFINTRFLEMLAR